MHLSINELTKIFDFILKNNIDISRNNLFNRDILLMIKNIVKNEIPNNFILTEEQSKFIIDTFINSNNIFNECTPDIILENDECIKKAIERDINGIDFIKKDLSKELKEYIIQKALNGNYILNAKSPRYLKSNFNIALNSIKLSVSSASYIYCFDMDLNQIEKLMYETSINGYVLSNTSPSILREDKKVVLGSIKKDINSINHSTHYFRNEDPDTYKYLLFHSYEFAKEEIIERPINNFLDYKVMSKSLEECGIIKSSHDKKNKERLIKLFTDAINTYPKISTFSSVFEVIAEEKWKEYKRDNIKYYGNTFGRVCALLRNSDDFEKVKKDNLIYNISFELGESKCDILYSAMIEYFNLSHSRVKNKIEKLEPYKNTIAKLCALYVATSKERYKKREIKEYNSYIHKYFKLNLNNPYILKRIVDSQKRKKLKKLYYGNYKEISDFVNNIIDKYSKELKEEKYVIEKMVEAFICYNYSKLEQIDKLPFNYKYRRYEIYEKIMKLIRRLNLGNISINGSEVSNYKEFIKFDEIKQEYIYVGISFSNEEIMQYNRYSKAKKAYENIKKEIIYKRNTLKVYDYDEIEYMFIKDLEEELPFKDEYYVFDTEYLKKFKLKDYKLCMQEYDDSYLESYIDDDSYNNLYNILINNGLIWLLFFNTEESVSALIENEIEIYSITKLIKNMKDITQISKEYKLDISNYKALKLLNTISECADSQSIAILGYEIIEKLCKSLDYTNEDEEKIVLIAKELVCKMALRSKATVPYVSGEVKNYKYSIYGSQDETILLSGINTDSCFRVNGNDNDLMHYCCLDKNGFIIKITDNFGNFIARASGFRNGNYIYLNQLRTIYDQVGNHYRCSDTNEKDEIIEVFKNACQDIIDTSNDNISEIDKIDFAFVTKSYIMSEYEESRKVSHKIYGKIGGFPEDNKSEDWKQFVNNTNNLEEAKQKGYLNKDYDEYALICIASRKGKSLNEENIIKKDVPALYERKRSKIIVTNKVTNEIYKKINKIYAIDCYFKGIDFIPISIPDNSITLIGDNWYILYNPEYNVWNFCILESDQKARTEFDSIKNILLQCINEQSINIDEISNIMQNQIEQSKYKILNK